MTRGRYALEWVDLGEGRDGDYNPDDPEDRPLLRADLYGDGEPLEDGSYCTGASVGTDPATLDRLALDLLAALPDDPAHFRRGVMERWTWTTLLADDPRPF